MSMPFGVDAATGSAALVAAIERRPAEAFVPAWPWAVIAPLMSVLPLPVLRRLT